MIRPGLTIQNATNGDLLLDESRMSGLKFSTNSHGSASMSANFSMSMREGVRLLDRIGTPDIFISAMGFPIWRGRLEDVEVTKTGIRVAGFGYWRALFDQPYTALWSDTSLANWKLVDASKVANRLPSMYSTDTNDRLFIAPTKNSVYGSGTEVGEWGYQIPSGSSRQITAISFDWTANLPTNWYARVDRYTSAYSYQSTITTFLNPDDGAVSTGTVSQTFTACDRVHILIYYGGGGTTTYTGETGTNNLQVANIRVKSTTSSTVTPSEIIPDVISLAPALSTSTDLIASNTIDVFNAVYEDRYPADILSELADRGDSSGNKYEVGVDNLRRLYYRLQGARSREWFITAENVQIGRSLNGLFNSVYAVYKDADGTALRTSASSNTTSVNRYGLTRKGFVTSDTTDQNEAQYNRDVFLNASKDLIPRATFSIGQVYGVGINPVPPFLVQAGDYITITDLPPTPDNTLNKARRMRITSTEYDCDSGKLTIEPEQPAPGAAPAFNPFANVTPMGRIRRDPGPREENPDVPIDF